MGKKHKLIRHLAVDAFLIALYFVIGKLTFSVEPLRISFALIPLLYAALSLDLYDGILIALIGEFLLQLTGAYGLTPTTPLWLLPPLLRVIPVNLAEVFYRKRFSHLEAHKGFYFLFMMLGNLLTTGGNTLVMYLDGLIMNYPLEYTYLTIIYRLLLSLGMAVLSAIVLLPVMKATRSLEMNH